MPFHAGRTSSNSRAYYTAGSISEEPEFSFAYFSTLVTSIRLVALRSRTTCPMTKTSYDPESRPLASPRPLSSLVSSHIACLMLEVSGRSERSGYTASRTSQPSSSWWPYPNTTNCSLKTRPSTECRRLLPFSTRFAIPAGLSRHRSFSS